jgi:hypothetical protein
VLLRAGLWKSGAQVGVDGAFTAVPSDLLLPPAVVLGVVVKDGGLAPAGHHLA